MKIKELLERRNALLERMQEILDKASTETRAMTDEENTEYQNAKSEVERLRMTITEMQDAERRASSSSGELGGLAGMVVRQFDRNHSGRKLDSIGESAGNRGRGRR